jgi:integrase
MGKVFARGNKLYLRIKGVDGAWQKIRTGLSAGEREAATKMLADLEGKVAAQCDELGNALAGRLTVNTYADRWLDKRKTVTVADDRTRLRLHVLPRIGAMLMADVKPRHLRDLVLELRDAGDLAPKTIRQITGLLHTMFKSAVIEEVIDANPVVFERGTLPKKADKDPTWRHEAIYTRGEIEAVISDVRILEDRRVLYALKSLAALRHGEAATLTWAQYDRVASPLGSLNLGKTKSGVPRRMPVHATLAKILGEWKLAGWKATYGRAPKADDLIVPTRRLAVRDANESQRQLIADLELLELRTKAGKRQHRRGHDMRRTFITLARSDGASKDILRWVTHGPSSTDMMDVYSTFDWSTLCAEVAKLKIDRREGKLIAMPIAAIAGDPYKPLVSDPHGARVPVLSQSRKTVAMGGLRAVKERPRRDSNVNSASLHDTQIEDSQHVAPIEVLPSDTGSGVIGTSFVPVSDPIGVALDQATDRWRGDRDVRALRRDLVRLLAELEDER